MLIPETYINLEFQAPFKSQFFLRETPVAKMKATLLTWALPLLFAGAVVAQPLLGHIVGGDNVNCRSCPSTDCQSQLQYKRGDVSSVSLPVSDIFTDKYDI